MHQTQKQLRIFDSKFENGDSKPDIFVAILEFSVAESEISDSEGEVGEALRQRRSCVAGGTNRFPPSIAISETRHGSFKKRPISDRLSRLVKRPYDPGPSDSPPAFSKVARHHLIFSAFSHGFDFDQLDLWSKERISAGADLSLASTGLTLEWLERVCRGGQRSQHCPEDY